MTSGKDMWRHTAMRAAVSFMPAVDSSVSTSSLSAGIDAAASVLKWLPSERRMPLSASCFAIVALPRNPCQIHGIAGRHSFLTARIMSRALTTCSINGLRSDSDRAMWRRKTSVCVSCRLRADGLRLSRLWLRPTDVLRRAQAARNQVSRQSPTDVCPRNNACLLLDGRGQDSR